MKSIICFVLFLLVLSIRADYNPPIPCKTSENCANLLTTSLKAICNQGICVCPNLETKMYQFCSNKKMIVNARFGGEDRNCKTDVECENIDGAKCFRPDNDPRKYGICDCHSHMVMSMDNRHCLHIVSEEFGKCTESIQCTMGLEGAECVDGTCRCRTNFHYAYTKKRCILNKVYGDECTRDEESCYQKSGANDINALGCSDSNLCMCRKNFRLANGLCEPSGAARTIIQLLLVAVMAVFSISIF